MTDAYIYSSAFMIWGMLCLGLCYPGSMKDKALATTALVVAAILACLAIGAGSSVA